jgi:hypothetical protein
MIAGLGSPERATGMKRLGPRLLAEFRLSRKCHFWLSAELVSSHHQSGFLRASVEEWESARDLLTSDRVVIATCDGRNDECKSAGSEPRRIQERALTFSPGQVSSYTVGSGYRIRCSVVDAVSLPRCCMMPISQQTLHGTMALTGRCHLLFLLIPLGDRLACISVVFLGGTMRSRENRQNAAPAI